jgi:hypothetical protein
MHMPFVNAKKERLKAKIPNSAIGWRISSGFFRHKYNTTTPINKLAGINAFDRQRNI